MRITEVAIENWRNIHRLTLTFGSRITIFHGPNETGKSTVQEAIRHALLVEASSSASELKELVPWGSSAKAHVELTIVTAAGDRVRIEKSFPKGEARLYLAKPGGEPGAEGDDESLLAEGRSVQPKIYEYLGVSADAADLYSLLWIDQGASLALFGGKPGDAPVKGAAQSLIKSIIKENLLSRRAEQFYREIKKEHEEVFQKSGQPRRSSRLAALDERETDLRRSMNDSEAAIAEAEGRASELTSIQATLTELEQRRVREERRLEQLEKKYEAARKLDPKLHAAEKLDADHGRLIALETKEKEALEVIPGLLSQKRDALSEWNGILDDRRAKAEILQEQLEEVKSTLGRAKVNDRKVLDALERGTVAVREMRLRLEASKLTVKATPKQKAAQPLRVSCDEAAEEAVDLREPRQWSAARSVKLSLDAGPEIECLGPLSHEEWEKLSVELEHEQDRLDELLATLECRDLAEAKESYDTFLRVGAEKSRLEAQVASLLGPGANGLVEELAEAKRAEEELAAERREAEALGVIVSAAVTDTDTGAVDKGAAGPARRLEKDGLRRLSTGLSVRLRDLSESRRQRSEILGSRSREEFTRELFSLKEEIEHAREAIATMEPKGTEKVEEFELKKQRAEIDRIAAEIAEAGRRHSGLSALQSQSPGLLELKEKNERELASVRRDLAAERRRTDAVELLIRLIEEEKEEIDRNIVGPLKNRLTEAFREVVGNRYSAVEINDQLGLGQIIAPALNAQVEVGVEALSYGTREQLSFLFRLLLAQFLSSREPQVMMLDDTFVNTDSDRRDRLFDIITADRSELQFILFTCHGDYYKRYASRHGVALIDITQRTG